MKKVIIVGAGGCGREVMQWALDCVKAGTAWDLLGFIDDNPDALQGLRVNHPILGSIKDWQPKADEYFICGIATPHIKRRIVSDLKAKGAVFLTLIHPSAIVSATALVGEGVVMSPFSVFSDNTVIGDHVFINLHTAIGHDARVGDYSVISSYCDITGGVSIGKDVFLGSHAVVVPKVKVGDGAYLCAGSVVMNRVAPGAKVLGNPARPFKI